MVSAGIVTGILATCTHVHAPSRPDIYNVKIYKFSGILWPRQFKSIIKLAKSTVPKKKLSIVQVGTVESIYINNTECTELSSFEMAEFRTQQQNISI